MPFVRRIFFLVLLLGFSTVRAADWPGWRGADRNGHVAAKVEVPTSLPIEPKVSWKVAAGEGFASPVVARGLVILFDNQGGEETVRALSVKDGREVWRLAVDQTFKDSQGPPGPRCTPLIDGDRVYAQSCRGQLKCLRLKDGKVLWQKNFETDFGATFIGEKGNAPGARRHGNNGSPLVDGSKLIVLAGGTNGAGVVALNKETGQLIWKSTDALPAYAPPVIEKIGGERMLLCFMVEGLFALNPESGTVLCQAPMKTDYGRHVIAPTVSGSMVVAGSHQVGLVGTRIVHAGDQYRAEQSWLSKEAAINFSSPVSVGRYLYGVGPAKNLICVEMETGRIAWSQAGIFNTPGDRSHGGFIVMHENILLLTDSGELVLFRASPEGFEQKGRVQVCAANWCNPAYADGRLYVRDGLKGPGELRCLVLQ